MVKNVFLFAAFLMQIAYSVEITHFVLSSYLIPDKKIQMELDVTTPRIIGNYPVVLYLTGVEGLAPASYQAELINQTAQQGIVWLTISRISWPNPDMMTNIIGNVLRWLDQNFETVMKQRVPGVKANLDTELILVGHSAAGHAMTQYLNGTCGNAKMMILLSPVDGLDPLGIVKNFIITPGKLLPFAVPTLVIGAELDPESKMGFPACAPSSMANSRFYDAMSGPKWFMNVSKYGHCDFYNSNAKKMSNMFCPTCKQHCNFPEYRTMLRQAIVSFIQGILRRDRSSLERIEDGNFKVASIRKHDYMGFGSTPGPFCKRVNPSAQTTQTAQLQTE